MWVLKDVVGFAHAIARVVLLVMTISVADAGEWRIAFFCLLGLVNCVAVIAATWGDS
jgi:hypothetical protein